MTTTNKIQFRPAVRESIGLWINMIGGTGSGKTFSAMRLAAGIAGDKPFAVIDTENRRALHYADRFKFDHAELRPPFRPSAYAEAVIAADEAGYPVIVIDSGSHVWAGEGGILDWHEEILEKRAGDDWKKRESLKMAAWIEPKMDHKRMVQKLLQVKAHIILCLRAEEKVEMSRGQNGKMEIKAKHSLTGKDGWIPVCDKNLPFEATCSFLLLASDPGIPQPIKLQEQHKPIFPVGHLIDEEAGKRLAEWAKGSATEPKPEDADARRDAMLKHFAGLGVDADRILHSIGKAEIADIDADDLASLKTKAAAIKNGAEIFHIFPPIEEPQDEAIDAETVAEPVDELENLRANVTAALDALPTTRKKDLIAGKPLLKEMTEAELKALLAEAVE